jgi:hypothetical protein
LRVILLALICVGAGAVALIWAFTRNASSQPSFAERVAHNYVVLSPSESRKLVSYARTEYRCLVAHGARLSAPKASRTRITMSAPGYTARELVGYMQACDAKVGAPPPRSSLQARNGVVLVYLPKECLLDPSEVTPT